MSDAEGPTVDGMPVTLVHRDLHRVTLLGHGSDEDGEYLRVRHEWPRPGPMAGPHWHPALTERFVIRRGRVRFRIDGRRFTLGPGESVTVGRRQVHGFRNIDDHLVVDHEIRPPLRHREMFEAWHRLDRAGRTSRSGVPRNPLALGMLWRLQDGYIAGVPAPVQRLVFGGLARLARLTGYEARWVSGPSGDE